MKEKYSKAFALFMSLMLSMTTVFNSGSIIVDAEDDTGLIQGEEIVSEETVTVEEINEEEIVADQSQASSNGAMDDRIVTAIVELEAPCVIDAGLEPGSETALSYAQSLIAEQQNIQTAIGQLDFLRDTDNVGSASIIASDQGVKARYTNVLNGFAIEVPRGMIRMLQNTPGVKNVFESVTYGLPEIDQGYEPDMMTSGDMIGVNLTYSSGYQGEGMVVGILDTGLDTTHSAFAKAPATQKITSSTSFSGLNARSTYKSAKVPFAYDYADSDTNVIGTESHGTHVAGTVSGNNNVITGIAPQAQLAIFKVFSDTQKGAADEWIISALEDAVIIKPDVINMSLGSPAGDNGDSETGQFGSETLTMAQIYQRVYDSGILLSISAGNESYVGAANGYPAVSNPNIGIVGSPSTYPASLSVASIENTRMITDYFVVGGNTYSYSDSAESSTALFSRLTSKTPLEYVDCGLGSAEEIAAVNVSGKIALIKRGGLTFTEKQANAKNAGAVGAVIYNNVEGTINMSIDSSSIPCVSITLAAGEELLAAEDKRITLIGTGESFENEYAYQMSDFSSWGTMDDLSIKPEITAPGGHIYSSVIGGGYADYSGTSMAAPHMSGAMALVRQYARNAGLAASGADLNRIVNQLAMSTAKPVPYPGTNGYYSPRNAGAGLVNINDAMAANAYLSVSGTEDSRPKIELGYDANKTGSYQMTFTVNNISDSTMTYNIQPVVQTDYIEFGYDTLSPYLLDYTMSGNSTVTVAAHSSSAVTVTVSLTDNAKSYLNNNYPNGGFVEGYILLNPVGSEDSTQLSLPFVGFYGNWDGIPLFDASELNGSQAAVGVNGPFDYESYAELDTDNGYYDAKLIGMNAYDPDFEYFSDVNPDYMTVSSVQNSSLKSYVNSVGEDVLTFDRTKNTGLLYFSAVITKNANWIRFRVLDANNGTVYYDDGGYDEDLYKNYEPSYYALWNPSYVGWAGTNQSGTALAEGTECTLEIQISQDGGTTIQTMTLPVTIDNSKPQITGTSKPSNTSDSAITYSNATLATTASGKKYLKFKATDNYFLSAAQVGTSVSSSTEKPWSTSTNSTLRRISYTYYYLNGIKDTQVFYGNQKGQDYEVILDVSGISGSTYYVGLYDYTRFKTFYKVTASSQKEYKLTLDPAEIEFNAGEEKIQQYTVTDESGFAVSAESVNFSVSGNTSDNTAIDESGVLTIAADETASELIIRAELTGDSSVYAEASAKIIQAVKEFTVTASASAGGRITPEGTMTFKEGDTAEFIIEANDGYEIDTVTVNGEATVLDGNKLVVTVVADTVINATFKEIIKEFTAYIYPETDITEGRKTILRASAVNGEEPYRYKFTYRIDGVWYTIRDFSEVDHVEWIPETGGRQTVNVTVKDATGAQVKAHEYVNIAYAEPEELSAELTLPEDAETGKSVNISAAAKGGLNPYKYKFTFRYNGVWSTIQEYSGSPECVWVPQEAGKYTINVTVKDSEGTVVKYQKNLVVRVAGAQALDLTADVPAEAGIGQTITLRGIATGGKAPYQYKFTYKENGSWLTLSPYSDNDSAQITFNSSGKHNIVVYVKDADGTVIKKAATIMVIE